VVRKLACFFVLVSFFAIGIFAQQAHYPTKPVNVVVAYSAGGASDLTARLIAEYWKKYTGNDMVVTNVVGAEGAIAARQVRESRPDGYTVLWYHEAMLGNYYLGVCNLNWYDFTPACVALKISTVSVTRPDMPWNDLREAVEDAKANPGKYVYGLGTGGVAYWLFAGLESVVSGAWRTVPFEGGDTQRATALLGGHIDITMVSAAGGWSFLKSGQIKPLAVHDEERNPLMPDVPTAKELGYPDVIFQLTNTFFFPPKTPSWIVEEFNKIIIKIVEDPEFQKKAAEVAAAVPYFKAGKELEKFWDSMDQRYKNLVEKMNETE
jgi:tripartite-type tricarboxylate transporter receptor subunit TctC